jgi:hypothetical protein
LTSPPRLQKAFLEQADDELKIIPTVSAIEQRLKRYAVMREQASACPAASSGQ